MATELMQEMIDNEVAALHRQLGGDQTAGSGNDDMYGPALVINTLKKRYDYMLNHADLVLLLPFYNLKKNDDDCIEVIGDPEVLRQRLRQHVRHEIGTLVLILHQPPIHWATLVVCNRSIGFFADSVNKKVHEQYKAVLKQFRNTIRIRVTSQLQQADDDGVNCGFWALQNAQTIRSWIADNDRCIVETQAPILLHVEQDRSCDHFVQLREKMMAQVIAHYKLNVANLQMAMNETSAVQSSCKQTNIDVCEAESLMDVDDDMEQVPTELFSTRVRDQEQSEKIDSRFTVIDYKTLKADIKAGRRVVSQDTDSLLIISTKCETFTGGNGRLDYPLKCLFPLPEKNEKLISILMEKQKIICNDDYRWSVMRFGNYGVKSVYFTFYHPKNMPIRFFRKQFSNEIVKTALNQCLLPSDETSTQQSLDFNEHGEGSIRFYRKDWPKVSRAIDEQLTNWSFFTENEIEQFYFYTAEHGMQDDREDAIEQTAYEMNVKLTCPHIVLVQAHLALTLTALENELVIVKTEGIGQVLRSEANVKCSKVRAIFTKFIMDAGHVTACYSYRSPYTRTYAQTYHPSERLVRKLRHGLLVNYFGLGGASFKYFPHHTSITKFRENARTQMSVLEQYERVATDGRIRLEDVHSADTIDALQEGINSRDHILLKQLAKNGCLLSFSPWPQYLRNSIGSDIKLLRSAMEEIEIHGCCRLTQRTIVELNKTESKVKYFLMPHKFKAFDYITAKDMIKKQEISIISFAKSSSMLVGDTDVGDYDSSSDVISDQEEVGEEVVYDDEQIHFETATSDQNHTPATGSRCLLDSINLKKFSGHVLVATYVPTLFKFLPTDNTHKHPLRSLNGKIEWLFTVIASVARLVRLDGSEANTFVQNPKTAFKAAAIKAFVARHKLERTIALKGTVSASKITKSILHPDKLLPSILISFLKLDVDDKIVETCIKTFVKQHVDYFPNAFLDKNIALGRYAYNQWWRVAGSSGTDFPEASIDDSAGVRQIRNLKQYRPVDRRKKNKYSNLKNNELWIANKLNKGRRKGAG